MSKVSVKLVLIPLFVLALVGGLAAWIFTRVQAIHAPYELGEVGYVDENSCIQCHQPEYNDWKDSDHDKAMDHATVQTVLGDFDDVTFEWEGITSRFFTKEVDGEKQYWVNTEGPDGQLADYHIEFVFGVRPLQQYLIAFPGGRYQCLPLAWDSRTEEEGGQRWFHLYPDEKIPAGDPLFWTNPLQNWNVMCGRCHTTDYHINYDLEKDTFDTTYFKIDVGCQACHGPGNQHKNWAEQAEKRGHRRELGEDIGLLTDLRGLADNDDQINTCITCHARGSLRIDGYQHGADVAQCFVPEVMREGLYHADGHIQDEVYVFGSFAQSEMYHHQNVKCSDCHNPHSLNLVAEGNALCVRCHIPNAENLEGYDNIAHHFHETGTPGASCVECHMPTETYMVVDPRRDHSMRLPRPDLTVSLGTPNACNACHTDQSAQWAADAVVEWYGPDREANLGVPNHAQVFTAARQNLPSAEAGLIKIVNDPDRTDMVKATALLELRRYPTDAAMVAIRKQLNNPSHWVRFYAVGGLDRLPPIEKVAAASPMLKDASPVVQAEAARILTGEAAELLTPDMYQRYETALEAFKAGEALMANLPGARVSLAYLAERMEDWDEARKQYKIAIEKDPTNPPALTNLATLENRQGNNAEALALFKQLTATNPGFAEGWYSLGLLSAEMGQADAALAALSKAAELAPDNLSMVRNYAVALHQAKRLPDALAMYQKAVALAPNDPQSLHNLAIFYAQVGMPKEALVVVKRLRQLLPNDPGIVQLETQLQVMVFQMEQQGR